MSKPNTASTAKICKQSFEKGPNFVSNSKICELDHLLPLSLVMVYLVLVGFVQFLHLRQEGQQSISQALIQHLPTCESDKKKYDHIEISLHIICCPKYKMNYFLTLVFQRRHNSSDLKTLRGSLESTELQSVSLSPFFMQYNEYHDCLFILSYFNSCISMYFEVSQYFISLLFCSWVFNWNKFLNMNYLEFTTQD